METTTIAKKTIYDDVESSAAQEVQVKFRLRDKFDATAKKFVENSNVWGADISIEVELCNTTGLRLGLGLMKGNLMKGNYLPLFKDFNDLFTNGFLTYDKPEKIVAGQDLPFKGKDGKVGKAASNFVWMPNCRISR